MFPANDPLDLVKVIVQAELALGTLSRGELRDLLLDNFAWIQDSAHADRLLVLLGRGAYR